MAKRKTNKSEAIRQHMAKHPKATVVETAKALNVKPGLVYQVKVAARNKGKRKTTKGTPVAIGINVEVVIAAANLVKLCGSAEQAKNALKAAERVLAVLGK